MDRRELYHHGILGQKWGRKNGPPYPLDSNDHSASEKKAGWRKSLDKDSQKEYNNTDEKSHGLSDKQKKAIKIGATVAATALVAYGAYKLADSGELNRLASNGKAWLAGETKPTQYRWSYKSELADKMSADKIFDTVVKDRINPRDWHKRSSGGRYNCRRCTFAYELSRRGFDVEATGSVGGSGQTVAGQYNTTHKGGPYNTVSRLFSSDFREYVGQSIQGMHGISAHLRADSTPIEKAKDIFSTISKNYPNGARGELGVTYTVGGAHSMAWEIVNNKPVIFDCQSSTMCKTESEFADYLGKYIATAATERLDNVKLNADFLQRWVKSK